MGGIVDSVTSVFKGPPKPPSAGDTIEAQKQANRVNQYTPGGNVLYGNFDADGNFVTNEGYDSVQVTESPEQEALRKQREGLAGSLFEGVDFGERFFTPERLQYALPNVSEFVGDLPGTRTTADIFAGLTPGGDIGSLSVNLPAIDTDYSAANKRAADAVFDRGMSYYQPEFDNQTDRVESDLAARGIVVGSDAYSKEKDRLERSQGRTREDLALSAITAGNNEAARLFGQDVTARNTLFGENANIFDRAEGQRLSRFNEGSKALALDEMQRGARLGEEISALDAALRKQNFIGGFEQQNEANAYNRARLAASLAQTDPRFVNVPGVDAVGATSDAFKQGTQYYQNSLNDLTSFGSIFL